MTIHEYGEIWRTTFDIYINKGRHKIIEYVTSLICQGELTEADAKELIDNIDED